MSDVNKRHAYDSNLDFDESIPPPKDVLCNKDFYELFGACFERNSQFVVAQKKYLHFSRSLGNDDLPIDDVYEFYDY